MLHTFNNTQRKTRLIQVSIVLFAFLLCISTAFAADNPWVITENGTTVNLTEMNSKFSAIWQMLCNIGYPLAAVGFAWNAIKMMMMGDEKDGAKAKKAMIYCLVAVAALMLLPTVVDLGISLGRTYGWDPHDILPPETTP